ncbi:MAG: hypothetical protein M1831_001785 [Alyxoria varia]|nr:MAG: hypothetical protein M1831_001785 [Alyxoria varia]
MSSASYGLHELSNPQTTDPDALIKADLVAVHGLGGDAFDTWTNPKSGFLWLRDSLPSSLQSLRIFSFGYNANLFVNGASGRSFTFAEDLLAQLNDERVAVALIMAQNCPNKYGNILNLTRHIFFFGTPHQGAQKSAILDFLNNLASSLQLSNSNSATKELRLWSDSLLETLVYFSSIVSKLSFTTFWETKPTKGVQVVHEGSARMNIPSETVVSLDANHVDLCKFHGMEDSNYRKVLRRVTAEITKLQNESNVKEHAESDQKPGRAYFEVPFPQNPKFVPRESISQKLDEKLDRSSESVAVIHGLGGVGKTQVAIAYCYEKRFTYDVFWVNATAGNFASGYERIATAVGLSSSELQNQDNLLCRVQRHLENASRRWLLVLDNADDPNLRELKYRPLRGGFTLFTTRTDEILMKFANPGDGISLESMTPAEAKETFLRLTDHKNPEQDQQKDKLLELLGYLPLAIAQAAAYIYNVSSCAEYLEFFQASEDERIKLLERGIDTPYNTKDVQPAVMSTWNITLSNITRRNTRALKLLGIMSYFDPRNIHRFYLHYKDVSNSEKLELMEALALLKSFSLISQRADSETYDVHPLRFTEDNTQKKFEETLPHVLTIVAFSGKLEIRAQSTYDNVYNLYTEIVELFQSSGRLKAAETYARQALSVATRHQGPDSRDTVEATCLVVATLRIQEKYTESFELAKKTATKSSHLFGDDHLYTIEANLEVVMGLDQHDKVPEAVEFAQNLVRRCKQRFGEEHVYTLRVLRVFARLLSKQGNTLESVGLLREVLDKEKRMLGEGHVMMLSTTMYLSTALEREGSTDESIEMFKDLFHIYKTLRGEEDAYTLVSSYKFSSSLFRRDRSRESVELMNNSIQRCKKILGWESEITQNAITKGCGLWAEHGQTSGAVDLLQDLLRIETGVSGSLLKEGLLYAPQLAEQLAQQGKAEESVKLLSDVIEKAKEVFGDDDENTMWLQQQLSETQHSYGEEDVERSNEGLSGEQHSSHKNETLETEPSTGDGLTFPKSRSTRFKEKFSKTFVRRPRPDT